MAITKGLVLGKFMPFHKGHRFLIESAAQRCDQLTIMVCSIKSEPIPGYLRYHWVKETFPGHRVLHVQDENPQAPQDHPFFWEIWLDTIQRNCPNGLDVFFSSESYGEELAKRLNIHHVMVDKERIVQPISGTQIRQNPYKNWSFIPKVVRSYYVKKVVLTGPESVGKSFLSHQLADHFQTNFVEEYGRTYTEQHGIDLDALDFAHIAGGQLYLEEEAAKEANRVLFCDTDLIVTQIWGEIFLQSCPQWIIEMNHLRRYDLFLLLKPDIDWVDDGTRAFGDIRMQQFERIRSELESRNLNYQIISGHYDNRLPLAVKAVKKLLALD